MSGGLAGGLSGDQLFWVMLSVIAAVTIVAGVFLEYLTTRLKAGVKIEQVRAREETRREVAAYVAEGSMTPEDAERILAAEPSASERLSKKAEARANGAAVAAGA